MSTSSTRHASDTHAKRITRLRLQRFCMLAAVSTLLFSWSRPAVAEDDFEAFFRDYKDKRDGIGALEAAFVQRTFLPQEVVTTEGTIYYSRPRRIAFMTDDPERAILVDERRGYEYDADIKQITIFEIEDHPRANIFFLGFDDDTEALQTAYALSLFETDDERGSQGIKIEPRPANDDNVYFIEASLYLRDEDYLPYRIHIVNDSESQLFIDVSDIRKQPEPDLEQTRIFVPEGVTVIENDRVADTVEPGGRYFPAEAPPSVLLERPLPPEPLNLLVPLESPDQPEE